MSFPHGERDQVLNPYRTTAKITVLYILILVKHKTKKPMAILIA
jgi:hypothetical protein